MKTADDPFPRGEGVYVLFGSRNGGLSGAGHQLFSLAPHIGHDGDRLGSALAGGDFDGDGATDLAIGIPGRDVPGVDTQGGDTIQDAGAVLVLFGRAGVGLISQGSLFFDETDLFQADPETAGFAGAGDRFGSVLAAKDFDGDGRDDLAMGVPLRNIGRLTDAGAVFVRYSTTGALAGPVQFWEQTKIFGPDVFDFDGSPTESGDRFGSALAAGDFDGDGRADLAIGVPFDDVLVARGNNVFERVRDAGSVAILYGSPAGLSITGRPPLQLHQGVTNIDDDPEVGDRFGSSLTAWNFGRNGPETRQAYFPGPRGDVCFSVLVAYADLAIGVPFEDVGSASDAGAVNVVYGSANGLTSASDQFWTQSNIVPDVGASETGDHFGGALY